MNKPTLLATLGLCVVLSGCSVRSQTVIPAPVVAKEASFDGNRMDSGDRAYGVDGAEKSEHWYARYRALAKIYGNKFTPPIDPDDMRGIEKMEGGYLVTAEISARFTKMNMLAKSEVTP